MKRLNLYISLYAEVRTWEGENLSHSRVLCRLVYYLLKYNFSVVDFFMMRLHKEGTDFRNILTIKEFNRTNNRLNPVYYRMLLEDKYIFDRFLKSSDFPLAKMTGIVQNGLIYWFQDQKTEPLEQIIHHDLDCFVKMHTKWGGQAVHKLVIHNGCIVIDNLPGSIISLKQLVSSAIHVIQETVVQHPVLGQLNESSVNTIRMITIHDGVSSHNLVSYVRMGKGSSFVDNISQGGLACGINEDSNLHEYALDIRNNPKWIRNHPTSGTAFSSITIPYYQESLALVKRMHNTFHCFFTVSWDVAITGNGPLIIEGNPVSGLVFEQWMFGGLRDKYLQYARSYAQERPYLL
jgi:hypothetical protein